MTNMNRLFVVLVACLLWSHPTPLRAQIAPSAPDILRGRVTSDSGRAVSRAVVLVVRVADQTFQNAVTDSAGAWTVSWPERSASYTVRVTAQGFVALSRTITRTANDSVLIVNMQIARAANTLATVVTRAVRPQPLRDGANVDDEGASTSSISPANAARRIGPDLAGDLSAIAAMTPGIMSVAGGISVFGLGSAQNSVTLNGLSFASADIPRDAATRVRVTSSSYDPSIGWFSGARTQVDLLPGDLFTARSGHVTADTPHAQYADPVAARLGQRFTNVNASLGGTGQLIDDQWAYNYGVQGGRKVSDFASLLNASPSLLQHSGVATDSVSRLVQLLAAASVPQSVAGTTDALIDENISFIGRIDRAPFNWVTQRPTNTSWGITGYGKWSRLDGQGLSPLSISTHSGRNTTTIGSVQGELTHYFTTGVLSDVRTSVGVSQTTVTPTALLPDGRVLVQSTFPDGSGGVSSLAFGGNAFANSSTRAATWETIGDLQWIPEHHIAHKFRVSSDVRLDVITQDANSNTLGMFTYTSLANVAANSASSFTRSLASPTRRSAAWNAFAGLGDTWRATQNLVLKYGVRAEGTVFGDAPRENESLAQQFGVHTSDVPNTFFVSPRFGGQYNVPGKDGRPLGSLRGGIGAFRNLVDPSLLGAASVMNGLPNGARQLTCVGDATPLADWSAYAADVSRVPTTCRNGAAAVFTDASAPIRIIDHNFTAPQSWRGTLGWSSSALHMPYSIELAASNNRNQRGSRELNFSGVPQFVTSDEQRPVFAPISSIVPSSGVVSTIEARRVNSVGRITDGVSDLESQSRQATFTVRPYFGTVITPYLGDVVVGYTLASVRDVQRGFDMSTFGDPTQREWARGALDARHQLVVQGVVHVRPGWNLFFYGHVQSGTPYTPLVRTDVNGDGLANDRAFVIDPTRADALIASAMRTLLSSTSPSARRCLEQQLGRAATRASCETPWSASFNTSLRVSGAQLFNTNRVDITLNFANPLAGIDQLLHGDAGLRGWGTAPAPDPVLLDVRGFDATSSRFRYAVNPRFGATSARTNLIRAPFRVTLDVSLDLGPPQTLQQLDRWLRPGRAGRAGAKLTAADLQRRYQRTVPDPFAEVLQEADSLLLTPSQVRALQATQDRYRQRIDFSWKTLASELAALPDNFDARHAYQRTDAVTDELWEYTRQWAQTEFKRILTPDQQIMLTGYARLLFNAHDRLHVRIFPRGG